MSLPSSMKMPTLQLSCDCVLLCLGAVLLLLNPAQVSAAHNNPEHLILQNDQEVQQIKTQLDEYVSSHRQKIEDLSEIWNETGSGCPVGADRYGILLHRKHHHRHHYHHRHSISTSTAMAIPTAHPNISIYSIVPVAMSNDLPPTPSPSPSPIAGAYRSSQKIYMT